MNGELDNATRKGENPPKRCDLKRWAQAQNARMEVNHRLLENQESYMDILRSKT